MRVWDTQTGAHIRTLRGHRLWVYSVSYSPDGSTLASVSVNGTVRVWDTQTGAHIRTFTGTGGVNSVASSSDGTTLASGSWDGTVLLWELTPPATVEPPQTPGDVSADSVVNIQDLVFVTGALGNAAAAPSLHPQVFTMLTAADVEGWLTQAQGFPFTDAISQRGVLFLEQLQAALTPKETVLLLNYPNPFNPETWIPYHLADAADVHITIYDIKGAVVRQLDLGH